MASVPRKDWAPIVERILETEEHSLNQIAEFCGVGRSSLKVPEDPKTEKNISPQLLKSLEHFEEFVVNGQKETCLLLVSPGKLEELKKMCVFLDLGEPHII